VDHEEIERRFKEAFEQAGLLKTGEAEGTLEVDATEVEEKTDAKPVSELRLREGSVRPPTVINLFQHPDAHPYVLDLALLKKYGPEWMEWEGETLRLRIPRDFPTTSVSDLNIQKIQAAKTLHYVDTYWRDWDVFLPCTMALNGLFPDFNIMQVPTVAQCAVSVDTANRIRSDVDWSDEVRAYLNAIHRFDGILCPFEPLEFVEVDVEGLPIDCEEIQELWPEVRRTKRAPTEESVTAEQLRRMLIVQDALKENRDHLQAQLPMLLHA
jgi:hypothetical protein